MRLITSHRVWYIPEPDWNAAFALAEATHQSPLLAHLLQLRGQRSPADIKRFLQPSLSDLSDPFELPDMKPAVERIEHAKKQGERVLVFGDYDVDGICAAVILTHSLTRIGFSRKQIEIQIPSRDGDGYGIKPTHVRNACDRGVSLILAVDNGITAWDAAATAQELGVDLIIADHHIPEGTVPFANAVVATRLLDASHPSANLCGAGIAFFMARALGSGDDNVDLACLATLADAVPLLGDNRVIARCGLNALGATTRLGLRALFGKSKIDETNATSEKITFEIIPRLNAGGRMGDASLTLRLLLADTEEEAHALVDTIETTNTARREETARVLAEALDQAEALGEVPAIVVHSTGWSVGVIGIVAGQLQEQFNRPCVVIAFGEDGSGTGSARCPAGYDLMAILRPAADDLVRVGGHAQAAGLTIRRERLDAFIAKVYAATEKYVSEHGISTPLAVVDAILDFPQITPALLNDIQLLEPFGEGNPTPTFLTRAVRALPGALRVVGKNHLSGELSRQGFVFRAIGFGLGHRIEEVQQEEDVDIFYTPQWHTWRNQTEIRLGLHDITSSKKTRVESST